jgi:NitT/TauT family transport system ATP-binding protein
MNAADQIVAARGTSDPRAAAKVIAHDLQIGYEGKDGERIVAVDGLSMTVPRGRFVSIVGRSGCGKTTFLLALQGLKTVDGGTLTIDGADVVGPRKRHGMVFQDASLMPWRSVYRNVTYGVEVQNGRKAVDRAKVMSLLGLVGLSGFESSYPHQLSGGMRQRANLARALLIDPELLLLDEPFGALDALTRAEMQVELTRIWQTSVDGDASHRADVQRSRTAVLITHDVEEAVYLSDEVIVFTARPARVRQAVPVPFPRPRSRELCREHDFQLIVRHITELLTA